jgi:hypothetical protein
MFPERAAASPEIRVYPAPVASWLTSEPDGSLCLAAEREPTSAESPVLTRQDRTRNILARLPLVANEETVTAEGGPRTQL